MMTYLIFIKYVNVPSEQRKIACLVMIVLGEQRDLDNRDEQQFSFD